jgi:acetyltransferase-like isoleucine patch superfamily enzyme
MPNFNTLGLLEGKPSWVDQKVKIRGLGKVEIGKGCFFGTKIGGRSYGESEIQVKFKDSRIKIGDNVCTNNNLFISCAKNIIIGSNTVIGERVTIFDFEGHGIRPSERKKMGIIGIVEIGENVWIGNNVIILRDTYIGDNTIVAAGAIVKGSFPANVLIGGIPAKVIKQLPS